MLPTWLKYSAGAGVALLLIAVLVAFTCAWMMSAINGTMLPPADTSLSEASNFMVRLVLLPVFEMAGIFFLIKTGFSTAVSSISIRPTSTNGILFFVLTAIQ